MPYGSLMMKIIFEFVGGPNDGKVLQGVLGDASDADRYYLFTNHGSIGQRFKVASDYAVETLAREQLKEETRHHFQPHYYVVTDRVAEEDEVLVRAEYIEKPPEKKTVPPAEAAEVSLRARDSMQQQVQDIVSKTARSMAESYSHYWPAGDGDHGLGKQNLALHVAHVLLRQRFSVFAQAGHPDPSAGAVDLVGISPGQDQFTACQFAPLGDAENLQQLLSGMDRLATFWLSPRLTIAPCSQHITRVAAHCETGCGLVAGLHQAPANSSGAGLLSEWTGQTGGSAACAAFWQRIAELGGKRIEPIAVQTFPEMGAYYLLAAHFPIARPD